MPVPKAGGIDGLFVSRPACPADHTWCLTEPTALHSIGYDVTSLVASGAAGTVVMTSVLVYLDGTVARAELVPQVNRISWAESRVSFLRADLGVDAPLTPRHLGVTPPLALLARNDARTLAAHFNAQNKRHLDFAEAVCKMSMQEFDDWPLDPPRITPYVIRQIAMLGHAPVARSANWKHDNKLNDDDASAIEHEVMSEILELAVEYDQLDVTNLVCFEGVIGRLRFIEGRQRYKLEKARSAKEPAMTAAEEKELDKQRRATAMAQILRRQKGKSARKGK